MKLKIFKWLAPALLIGGGSISSVLLTSCNNVKYEIQQIQYQGDPSNVWDENTRTMTFNGGENGSLFFSLKAKKIQLDGELDQYGEGTVKGVAYYALLDGTDFPKTFDELWEDIQDGNIIEGGQMILVGNQQKLYPEQTTGINELKFGSWAYANNAHYTVYAVPDTTYYASSSGKADCKFGQKHIKFYDFTIIPDVDNDTI